MKIHIQILEVKLIHEYHDMFISAWTNQSEQSFKINKSNPTILIDTPYNSKKPFGLMLGAYGIRLFENQYIYHPCGHILIDMSKIKSEKPTTILSDLLDTTCVTPKMGNIHVIITWKTSTIPPNIPNISKMSNKMGIASEHNLDYISPWGIHGLEPSNKIMNKIHSPYYTGNTGITMPSGAFLLNLGTTNPTEICIESHKNRLLTTMKMCGLDQEQFLLYADKIFNKECDTQINNALTVLARTLTMHSNQVMKYVPDVQFIGKKKVSTERWECPRYMDNNYVGDCEDCAKEIMIEIHEWKNMKSNDKFVVAVQKMLTNYIPMLIQGCVEDDGEYKNHIWAALVPEPTFLYSQGRTNYASGEKIKITDRYAMPTILLEGTGETKPLKTSMHIIKKINKKRKELFKEAPIFEDIQEYDIEPHKFYKYVVAAMSPVCANKGVIDYIFIDKSLKWKTTYGIQFEKWLSGKYSIIPACRHSAALIKNMEHICSYDKPIPPLTYETKIISSFSKPIYHMSEHQMIYGYRFKNENDEIHQNVLKAVNKLNKKGWKIFGNVVDHNICLWAEWVIEQPIHSRQNIEDDFKLFLL